MSDTTTETTNRTIMFEIRNRWTGAVLFKLETTSMKLCVEAAVKQKADLRDADLSDADLRDADLRDADLRDADLRDANLSDADLRDANLSDADLRDANLTSVRDDFWAILSASPKEVPALRQSLIDGKVDGSTYEGECACLVGTLANARHCKFDSIPGLRPNSARPAEAFFTNIKRGSKPENNQCAAIVVGWIDTWLTNIREAFEK